MDGWTDVVLTLGFFLDILHVRKVAKKILSFSKYSTSSHSCVRRDGRRKRPGGETSWGRNDQGGNGLGAKRPGFLKNTLYVLTS